MQNIIAIYVIVDGNPFRNTWSLSFIVYRPIRKFHKVQKNVSAVVCFILLLSICIGPGCTSHNYTTEHSNA